MKLTLKAQTLREPLNRVLADLRAVLSAPCQDILFAKSTLRMSMADALVRIFAPRLQEIIAREAPGICLVYLPWQGSSEIVRQLKYGEIDLVATAVPEEISDIKKLELNHENFIIAMRNGHPIENKFNLDSWLEYPHVVVSSQGDTRGSLDEELGLICRTRKVGAVVPGFLPALELASTTDLIATVPSWSARGVDHLRLKLHTPPIRLRSFRTHIAWHERNDGNQSLNFVASIIRDISVEMSLAID